MCLRFLGRFKRFAAVGGPDGVLKGVRRVVRRGPNRSVSMLNRRNYTRNWHDWNPMPDMELGSLRGGGFACFGRGFAKRGVQTIPPNPPGYGPGNYCVLLINCV